MFYILLPLLVSLVIILLISGIASAYLNAELENARDLADEVDDPTPPHGIPPMGPWEPALSPHATPLRARGIRCLRSSSRARRG